MPELPDVELYREALRARFLGEKLHQVRVASPFLLRSVDPPLSACHGRPVCEVHRLGKRLVIELDGELFLVLHLMVAGRLHLKTLGAKIPGRVGLAAFDLAGGTLLLTEAAKKKRAALHVVQGRAALAEHDPGGVEPLTVDTATFARILAQENHTLKRALTDPRWFSGIGNAYSDEILHRAHLSPLKMTQALSPGEVERLHAATREVLAYWLAHLRELTAGAFPEQVTAFREGMSVHGRYRKPCPICGAPIQRIRYAENETNYCAKCQTGGKLLADRSLSRLLKQDWPRTLEELETLKTRQRG